MPSRPDLAGIGDPGRPTEIVIQLDALLSAIVARRGKIPRDRALLVGISGIDASGKGFVTRRIAESLGHNVAAIGADGWLNLPHVRFDRDNPAEHFYEHGFRFRELFENLVLPLRQNREIDLPMDYVEETAASYRPHRYQFQEIDIILLEGIFLLQRSLRHYFDLTCWVDCSFETALARAIKRCQEGLPPSETVLAFSTIYFPAQRLHFERDAPQLNADLILPNEAEAGEDFAGPAGAADFAFQAETNCVNERNVSPPGRFRKIRKGNPAVRSLAQRCQRSDALGR